MTKLRNTFAARFEFGNLFILVCALLIFSSSQLAQTGSGVDLSFNPAITKNVTSEFTGNFTKQTDGKILVFGVFQAGGTYLNRLNPDGTIDTSFNCSVCTTTNVYSALALPNGQVMTAGFTNVPKVYRLNGDGSLDATFNVAFPVGNLGFVSELELLASQPDGKVLIRRRSSSQGYSLQEIFRLNTNGSSDSSFTTNGYGPLRFSRSNYSRVYVQPDGKILIGGNISGFGSTGFIDRVNADGTPDSTFESPTFADLGNLGSVGDFDVYPDGSIIIPGRFTTVNSISKIDLVKLLPGGNVDLTFSAGDIFNANETSTGKARILPNGQFLTSTVNSSPVVPVGNVNRIYRFNPNGSLDSAYNPPSSLTLSNNWILDNSSRAVVFGILSNITRFLRLNADSTLDTSFNPIITKRGITSVIAIQPDQKVLIYGDFDRIEGVLKNRFARLNPDGTLDPTFDSGSGFDAAPRMIALQPDSKILAIGEFTSYNGAPRVRIVRLNSDGSLDGAFSPTFSSSVYSIAPLVNGKILVGGNFTTVNGASQPGIALLNANGSLDAAFNPIFGTATVNSIVVESDGKITVGGTFSGVNGFNRQNLVRLNSDGTLDSAFNAGSISFVTQVIRQPDGRYIVRQNETIFRRNNDGSSDLSFTSPSIDGPVNTIYLEQSGNIVIGGAFTQVNSAVRRNLTRLAATGALDTLFLPTGSNNVVHAIAGQADGKILAGGNFVIIGDEIRSGIARINPGATVSSRKHYDFDGDGRSDISVFRPSENKWYVLKSSDSTVQQQVFAIAGDIPVPADFDGDGKTDFAIFRPSTGDWWSLSSSNGSQVFAHLGQTGDIPRPSDFDGDGRADYIVFRPSNNFWYRVSSANGAASNQGFGSAGDKPVIGDFDGDGKSDVAIYRPSTGDWWWQSSVDNAQRATRWGISTDIPTPADFDGDGKTDFAVYRPSTGVWYIVNSSNFSFTILNFGISEDKPVPADYDGDGKADVAVFRPGTGIWYLLRSSSGFGALQFGISTDLPTPNAFLQ